MTIITIDHQKDEELTNNEHNPGATNKILEESLLRRSSRLRKLFVQSQFTLSLIQIDKNILHQRPLIEHQTGIRPDPVHVHPKIVQERNHHIHLEEIPIDEVVLLTESIAEDSSRIAGPDLEGRQQEVDAFEDVPQLRR